MLSSYSAIKDYLSNAAKEQLGIGISVSSDTTLSLNEPLINQGADSLDVSELIVKFENELKVSLPDDTIGIDVNLQTIIDIIAEQKGIQRADKTPIISNIIQPVKTRYSKQDVFKSLKEIILKSHPEISAEKITRNASFWQTFGFDQYDLIEIIMNMEIRYKLLNNNINYLKHFTMVGEFCDNFYNILKEQFPESAVKEPVPILGAVRSLFNTNQK